MTSTRICLWSGPRNVSTALMYAFAQREDCTVVDEPFYGYYLKHTEAKSYHPYADEVLNSMETKAEVVLDFLFQDFGTELVFFKHMSHHCLDLDLSFSSKLKNILLTRDPREMIPSFAKEIPHPTMDDLGYIAHIKLMEYFNSHNIPYHILDAKAILMNPKKVLNTLCQRIGISFNPTMLSWKPGPRPEDGIWAKHWYGNVHKSTGFQPYQPKTTEFPEYLKPLLNQCSPLYTQLTRDENFIGIP